MLALASPVVLSELGWMAMGVVDSLMVGRIGPGALGAVSIGRAAFFGVVVFGMGLLLGLDALVSRSFGAADFAEGRRWLDQGSYLAVLASVPLIVLLRLSTALLEPWGIEPAVARQAAAYIDALSWGVLPLLLYTGFRRYLQAVNRARPVMVGLLSANLLNFVANWVLVFGHWGAPRLEAAGAGWATSIANLYLALFLAGAIAIHEREQRTGRRRSLPRPDWLRLRRLLALGLPAAGQLVVEVAVFAAATALAGRLDAASLAAHQIALTCASVAFMVPLGIASAGAVRVGQALGRGDPGGARRAGWCALLLAATFMSGAALLFVSLPGPLIRAFSADARVLAIGVTLLAAAALFQLFDGLQVVGTGILRGAGDTYTPFWWNLVGHWALGLPVGYLLCFGRGWGVVGLWIGWAVGLTIVGAVLLRVWIRTCRRFERRTAADTAPARPYWT